jgi:cellulose synthase operon protein B
MRTALLSLLFALAASAAVAQNATVATPVPPAAHDAAAPSSEATTTPEHPAARFPDSGYVSYNFKDLGSPDGLHLYEGAAEGGVTYMVRRDQVITAARLHLLLENSAGFPADTKLEVSVNGDPVGTVDVGSSSHAQTPIDLPIDPILLGDYNRVGFKLLGVALASCRINDAGPSMTVARNSSFDVATDRLPLASDLSVLPLPFFDDRDPHAVDARFAFAKTPSPAMLEAAGVVASWLGSLAGYRGVHLPASIGAIPNGNAIVFAVAGDTFPGIDLPQAVGPTVAMIPNPTDPAGKLLVVMGRDPLDLKNAARGLAAGHGAFKAGAVSAVSVGEADRRGLYDAPGWVPDTRPVKFSEITTEDQLRSHGIRPEPIKLDFRTAPDYFNWIDSDIPMQLRFHVTPERIVDMPRSRLDISLNNNNFKSVPLAENNSFFQSDRTVRDSTVEIPPFLLTGRNRLTLYFDMQPSPECDPATAATLIEEIDPGSTIDLSQSPHYAPMPNLSFFANAGFPFTRHADLSETSVVMPNPETADDVEAFLEIMALFGEATGYTASQVAVIQAGDAVSMGNRDLLLIGSYSAQPLLASWAARTGLEIEGTQLRATGRGLWDRVQALFDWRNRRNEVSEVNDWLAGSPGGEGVLIGFRSPLDERRNVIAVTGSDSAHVVGMTRLLQDGDRVAKVQDDLVVQRADDVESYRLTRRYDVGSLARWTWLRWNLSDQPIVIALLLFAGCAALAAVTFVMLGVKARRRLQGANR